MIKTEVNKLAKASVSQVLVDRVARAVAEELKLKKNYQESLAIIADSLMTGLNKKYRKKDKTTDVLSFDNLDNDFIIPGENDYLGEIFICYPQLVRQAKINNRSQRAEFGLLFIHGLIHLLGKDHETSEKDAKFFDDKQQA